MRFSIGTSTLSRNRAAVFDSRIPCLSSGLALVKPSVPLSTTNHVGPPGASARIVVESAMVPLEIHCFAPLMR